jgi:Xaa-Pro aminopeptidase
MRYLPINSSLFKENREKFIKHLKPNSVAIFCSNDEMPKSGDQNFPFRQNNNIFYLSGIDQEQTILILYPDNPVKANREILFLRETNEIIAVWEGHKYTVQEGQQISGIQNIQWLGRFEVMLAEIMANVDYVYLNTNENIRFANKVPYNELRFAKAIMEQYPLHKYERAAPIMKSLRTIKSAQEIELIQKACNITEKAFHRVLKFLKAGVMEYEIEAEITHEFIINRANGHAYTPIIASGANACVLHYVENNQKCKDGDLVLLDFGAEYAYYASDLSRTIPVNGKFSKRQKSIYNAVLRVMKEAIPMLVEGNTIDNYHKEVCHVMEKELIGLGLFSNKDVLQQNPNNPLYLKYYMHGTSHYMGMDVHDLGSKQEPLKAGMVFSCEPGIYIQEEGIGIRLENDILITKNGPVDLMKTIPIEIDEIEELMN